MKGIVAHAACVPAHRIAREVIAAAWQTRSQGGQKLCARFDEDSLTLAATAAWDCLRMLPTGAPADVSGLVFASTTAPYLERQNASILAAVCDLSPRCLTADVGATLRAGTIGLALAFDRLSAVPGEFALVAAADTREAEPGALEEQIFGDAGAAIAVGDREVIAEFIARASRYDDFFETSRRDRDAEVCTFEGPFSLERGYHRELQSVITQVLTEAHVAPREISRLVLPAPDKRSHFEAAQKLGFVREQVQDIGWDDWGHTGCAMPLLLLSAALEAASPGDLLLVGGYGNGADAFLFRVTSQIAVKRLRLTLAAQRAVTLSFPSYTLFRRSREYRHTHDDGLEITNIFYAREESQNMRLHGSECRHCSTRHFPQAKVCAQCGKSDSMVEVALARTGEVFTYAVDNLAASPFPPTVMAVVNLDGGGRIYCEVVDVEPEKVRIGMPVELVLRRLREGGGLHHYYWKCRPRRW